MVVALCAALLLLVLVVWNAAAWPSVPAAGGGVPGCVSVLIPARNEEANIAACLQAVQAQVPPVREILVYDDQSNDGTAALVAAAAAADRRVRLLPPQELPAGWYGKPHACRHLARHASGEWLLFLDADARLREGAVRDLVAAATARGVTLLAPWPGLVMCGAAERLLLPMLNFVVFTLFPARLALTSDQPSLGLAHGACLLVRREEYERVDGHALVRSELFEDTALARAWRVQGLRSACLDGQRVVRVRMYDSFAAIWKGFLKNFHPAFRTRTGFWSFLALHATVFVMPCLVAGAGAVAGRLDYVALSTCGAGIAARLAQCARFRYPVWSALLHPVAETTLLALGLCSWYHYRLGRGVEWRGRRYHG